MRRQSQQAGFSLLELMVVVVIIGILSLMIVPRVINRPDQARYVRAQQDIQVLTSALALYKLDNLSYPTTAQGLAALVEKPASAPVPPNWAPGGYVQSLLVDPWGRPYLYLNPGVRSEIDVFSYGPDGQPEGEADVGNWTDG
ncbi:MAG: type II secretion system major pseudopilin GspG [Pseudomonadota bacterium]